MNCHGSGIVQHYKKSLTMISEFHCLQLPILDFSWLNYPFISKNPAAFRSSLPDRFLFWTFSDLICPFMSKNPAAFRRTLPDSFLFWTFPNLICPFMSKNPAAFRRTLPDSFLFWTFPGLIIHLYPKNQLLSVVHCLTASCFGLSRLNCPFMSKNPAGFRRPLPESFLFWTFPGLIIHLYPKNQLLSVVHCLKASYFGFFLT